MVELRGIGVELRRGWHGVVYIQGQNYINSRHNNVSNCVKVSCKQTLSPLVPLHLVLSYVNEYEVCLYISRIDPEKSFWKKHLKLFLDYIRKYGIIFWKKKNHDMKFFRLKRVKKTN